MGNKYLQNLPINIKKEINGNLIKNKNFKQMFLLF